MHAPLEAPLSIGFWQTHSQMAHKGAFSKPESILTALLGSFTGAPIVPLASNNPETHARALAWVPLSTGFLANPQPDGPQGGLLKA